jgi:hypothetical protein
MSPLKRWIVPGIFVLAAALALPLPVAAKSSSWKDAQGASFRGEPVELLGPFVLFRTGGNSGRRVPMHVFTPDECRRIAAEIAQRPARAAAFAQAKSDATGELVGKVARVQNRLTLAPADLASVPEPELLLVLAGSHNDGESWNMVGNMQALYWRMQRVYPGLVEAVFLGTRHDVAQHTNIAVSSAMPWLVADFTAQRSMSLLNGFIPREGTNMVLASRDGVPLAAAPATDVAAMRDFSDRVSELLWLMNPANPAGWADRLHYSNATRPAAFAQGEAPPLLIGNPLRAEGLRQYGVRRVAARLAVAADGKVTPTLLSGPPDVPAQLVEALTLALRQAVVAPAIRQGKAVEGSLDYLLEVPPADPQLDADRAWLASSSYPLLPITDWLVLRPIKVPEQEFDPVEGRETAAGKVEFKALEVNSGKVSRAAQMNAFNSDWFGAAGADSVRPKAGDRQKIDDATALTWEKITSKDGFVDMQTGIPKDYVVGYAWTEFTVPAATDAWLGLGSDDGVKIWLNGELVHDKWVRRQSRVDDDVVALHLKAGPNRLLIKIQNATIDWSFLYRVRTKPAR